MSEGRTRQSTLRRVARNLLREYWTSETTVQRIEETIFRVMQAEVPLAVGAGEDSIVPSTAEAFYRHLLALILDRAIRNQDWIAVAEADEATITALLEMDPFLRAPERWEALEQEEENTRQILEHAKDLLACSSAYTCRNKKCKSKRFRVDSQQIRSADEAMTTLIRCLECGTGWSEN